MVLSAYAHFSMFHGRGLAMRLVELTHAVDASAVQNLANWKCHWWLPFAFRGVGLRGADTTIVDVRMLEVPLMAAICFS